MQGFIIPELIIESLIRDGIQNVKADPTIIDSIFAQLTRSYNTRKYGETEIAKIKALLNEKEIPVLFSYNQVDSKPMCFTIMIGADTEDKRRAHLDDHYEELEESIVDADELEALHRVENMTVLSYDSITGKVVVDPSTNLGPVYKNMLFVDAADNEFVILPGISNEPGDKFFFIQKQAEVDISASTLIKSSLDYKRFQVRGLTSDISLVCGAHSKDALTTKYLYILLKYFIFSRKKDMISRGLYVSTYSGSDFNRDSAFTGDHVFTRFLTINGKVDDTWRSDQVQLIDNIEVDAIPVSCPDDE